MAYCCRDVYFSTVYSVREVFKYFPGAKEVKALSKPTEDGVYYDNFLGFAAVRIVGHCPNLSENGNCLIYSWKPEDCWDMSIGSNNCVLFRRDYEQGVKIVVK